jgi:hypothetical protein
MLVGLDSYQTRNVLKSDSTIRMHPQVSALRKPDKRSAKPTALSSWLIL